MKLSGGLNEVPHKDNVFISSIQGEKTEEKNVTLIIIVNNFCFIVFIVLNILDLLIISTFLLRDLLSGCKALHSLLRV